MDDGWDVLGGGFWPLSSVSLVTLERSAVPQQKMSWADILRQAYQLVRANKGGAGINGVTFTAIEGEKGSPPFWRSWEKHWDMGLYKLPTTSGPDKAHALRRRTAARRHAKPGSWIAHQPPELPFFFRMPLP